MGESKLSSLDFTLVLGCKVNCKYCPQGLLMNKYYGNNSNRERKLSLDNFKKVLEQVEYGSTIGFAGMSEPFLNESCADMIVYADSLGYKISLYTTLIGMTRQDFEKIKDISFDRLVLHIPDNENFSHFTISEEYLEVLRLVSEKMEVDFYSCHGTIHSSVIDIIDNTKNAGISLQDRAGNLELEGCETYDRKGRIICYRAWSSKAMNVSFTPELLPDGTLLLCCQDYGMKHCLGNLLQQSWEEIKNGDELKKYFRGLQDDSVDLLCRKCVCAKTMDELPPMQLRKHVLAKIQGLPDDTKLSDASQKLVKRFAEARTVCVYGLGKLFREHFFQELWDEGLGVTLFSDSNPKYHGERVNGVLCIAPEELKNEEELLVVLFVKNNTLQIMDELKRMGVENCITIDEVLDGSTHLCREANV